DDGILGLSLVKQSGGIVIAQDPDEADSPSMPERAVRQIGVHHMLRSDDMAAIVSGLVGRPGREEESVVARAGPTDKAEAGTDALETGTMPGPPTAFRCPECGGALWELRDGNMVRLQCHVGHAFTPDSLVATQAEDLEQALWTALRVLEESGTLRRRMAAHARERGMTAIAKSYEEHAQDSDQRARLLRRVIVAPADDEVESS
ncbi:MAG TPA: chemotaxis protein CheB, partial [Vicinamibacterales bacterium]|nr:chemotaxis protein CheB [Vicinamibacterales bacterium]